MGEPPIRPYIGGDHADYDRGYVALVGSVSTCPT